MSCERTPANRVTKENRKEYNMYFEGVKTNKDAMISETDGVTALIMDFRELEYISSAGLRVLLSARKTMNNQGSMVIKNASDEVKEIFDVTGFSDILTIE
jgi:anti-sigma B factor antagonist